MDLLTEKYDKEYACSVYEEQKRLKVKFDDISREWRIKQDMAVRARLHTGKFSLDKKICFVLNRLVAHGSSQDKEKLPVCKRGLSLQRAERAMEVQRAQEYHSNLE